MNRKILFRAKRIDTGEWVYGYYASRLIANTRHHYITGGDVYDWFPVDPSTIGQFTGLLDKNGKEIFEGDRIELTINEGLPMEETVQYNVRWGSWCWMRYRDNDNGYPFDAINARSCALITGTIHDKSIHTPPVSEGGNK